MRKKRIGRYIKNKIHGESFRAYVPEPLPPQPPLKLDELYPLLEKASHALAELNVLAQSIPNSDLFVYMYLRKEALLSSQIEGTQSSFSDLMLFEHSEKTNVSVDDVEEVSNYVKAINYGLGRLKENFPLSMRLVKEIHSVLLSGIRGQTKLPGEFRRSQNWIGGTRPGNALFVPPPPEQMKQCLSDLERFMHDQTLPILIKAGLIHVQFETIHPFLDGNGRLGRLLLTLLLCHGGLLEQPVLYLSLYLKQNRQRYYSLLQEVREYGRWEAWLEFFLEGVCHTSKQATEMINRINTLFLHDQEKINTFGRVRTQCEKALAFLKRLPQVTVAILAAELEVTQPTARSIINRLVEADILFESTGKQRDRVYVYQRYLTFLEEGAEPI